MSTTARDLSPPRAHAAATQRSLLLRPGRAPSPAGGALTPFDIACCCVADNDNARPPAAAWPIAVAAALTGPVLATTALAALLLGLG